MDNTTITIKAKRRLVKFADGADPEVDAPIEVIEREDIFTGAEAEELLQKMNITKGDALNGSN